MRLRLVKSGVILTGLVLFVAGCETKEDSACTPGATQTCACAGGGTGAQKCNSSGSGWETCLGCSTTKKDSGTTPCTPGANQSCACAGGGTGVQKCNSSGSGWGTCQGCPTTKKDTGIIAPDKGTTKITCPSQMLHPVGNKFCIDKFDQGDVTGGSSFKTKAQAATLCSSKGTNGRICSLTEIQAAVAAKIGGTWNNFLATTSGTGCCCPCGSWKGTAQTHWYPSNAPYCECWWIDRPNQKVYFRCCTDPK